MVLHIPFDFSNFKNVMFPFYVLSARFENPLRQVKGNGFYNRIEIKVFIIPSYVYVHTYIKTFG